MTLIVDDAVTAQEAVAFLLRYLGEDPTRPGLTETPERVVRSLVEMTQGYRQDPADILGRTFEDECDQMVVLRGVEFHSLCEHHLLTFTGTATLAYIPRDGVVVGLSKLARLVECYARRLQIQERMTREIAHALQVHLDPQGVGVLLRAHHSCMACRGVGKVAEMVTSELLGALRDDAKARSEFLAFA